MTQSHIDKIYVMYIDLTDDKVSPESFCAAERSHYTFSILIYRAAITPVVVF